MLRIKSFFLNMTRFGLLLILAMLFSNLKPIHVNAASTNYSYSLSAYKSGTFSIYGSYTRFMGSPYYWSYKPSLSFSIPDDATNIKVTYSYSFTPGSYFRSSGAEIALANAKFTTSIRANVNGSLENWHQWSGENVGGSVFYVSNSSVFDISSLCHTGVNTISEIQFYPMLSPNVSSASGKTWQFVNGDNFGDFILSVSYDSPTPTPDPTPTPNPTPTPDIPDLFYSYEHIVFIQSDIKLSSVISSSSLPSYSTLGNVTCYRQSILDWVSFEDRLYSIPYDDDIFFTVGSSPTFDSFVCFPLGIDYSTSLNSLNAQIAYLNSTADSINDNIESAHGANDALNDSNTQVDSALQDYKDKTDTSDQKDIIDSQFDFDLDTSIFASVVSTMSLFSSNVTLLWNSLGDFSQILSLFLISAVIGLIIGIVNHTRG